MKLLSQVLFISLITIGFHSFAEHEGPCANDAKTLCAGIEHGEGRIMKCLKEHKDKLSSECKAHGEKMKEAMKDIKEACHADVEKFCSGVEKGKGRIMRCMKEHKEFLSDVCKKEIEDKKKLRKEK